MTFKKFIIGFIALAFVTLAIGAAYLSVYLDRNLEGIASSALGREVRIEKGVSLNWSLSPGITVQGLWIGNADWGKSEYLARAEQASLRVDIAGLLQRRLELKEVLLQNAEVALEVDTDGRQNWSFGEAPGSGPGVLIHELKIENLRLDYRSPEGIEYQTDISKMTYAVQDNGQHSVDTRLTFRNVLIALSATSGIQTAPGIEGWSLNGRVEMPDTPPIVMTTQVEGSECCLQLKQLEVTSGGSDISGELSLPLVEGGRIEGSLNSNTLDLRPFSGHSDQPVDNGRPWLERELPSGMLQGVDGALRLKVDRLLFGALELKQLNADAELQKSHLKMSLSADNKAVTADLDLKPSKTGWQYALNQRGKVNLADLINEAQYGGDQSRAPLEISLRLRGSGASPIGLYRSARGQFLMVVGKGKLSKNISKSLPLGSVIYSLLGAILPEEKNAPQSRLECAVVQFDIAKGIATANKGLALRTGQLNVVGGGAVNLNTGAIDLKFKTAPRRGLGISFVGVAEQLFKVTGTVTNPTVALDVERAVTFGAMTWATAGLNILANSVLSRLSASDNPCEAVLRTGK